ncbi:MAG: RluA family pseudouridine synthase [Phototrophicaceae bacterium]
MPEKTFTLQHLKKPTRLDRVLRAELPNVGRKAINQLIHDKQVQVNGKSVWLNSWKINQGDTIRLLSIPDSLPESPQDFDPAWIIADDGDVIALNKPAGLLSQETKYGQQANLLDMAQAQFGHVNLFHRLDRDTSGVILLTRGGAINRYLDTAFKARTIIKHYVAMVDSPNDLAENGTIHLRLDTHGRQKNRMRVVEAGGKLAITDYTTYPENKGRQRVDLTPKTGRTHQLRVHLAHYNAQILGDRLYSTTASDYERLYLHAHQIILPKSDNFPECRFTAPLPDDFV